MRIIAGAARGRRLKAPRGLATRPMADRVKESAFAILGPPPPDLRVLDLFAGTGALSLEALSRGAAGAVQVEQAETAARAAHDNAAALGFSARVRLLREPVLRGVARLEREGARFGWVFVDPPYGTPDLDRTLRWLGDGMLVAPGGVVVAHHPAKQPPADAYGRLRLHDTRRYGQTEVRFYRAIV